MGAAGVDGAVGAEGSLGALAGATGGLRSAASLAPRTAKLARGVGIGVEITHRAHHRPKLCASSRQLACCCPVETCLHVRVRTAAIVACLPCPDKHATIARARPHPHKDVIKEEWAPV